MANASLIYIPGQAKRPVAREAPGRAMGKPHGSHIGTLSEQFQTIWLCRGCSPKFDYKRHSYYRERYYVVGACDACKDRNGRNTLYVHEKYLAGPGGRSMHGHSWLPG